MPAAPKPVANQKQDGGGDEGAKRVIVSEDASRSKWDRGPTMSPHSQRSQVDLPCPLAAKFW